MDIFALRLQHGSLSVSLNLWLILALVAIGAAIRWFILRKKSPLADFEFSEAELGVGKQAFKLRRNQDDLRVGYMIWVELSTRKVGLPIEFDHDVIAEVYDSWYQFFGVTRELIKEIPVSKLRQGQSIDHLIQLAIDVLNQGIRPHLTKWQAKYRRWYEAALVRPENADVSPQELQQRYPQYRELCDDMERVNKQLIYYRERMHEFVFGADPVPNQRGH